MHNSLMVSFNSSTPTPSIIKMSDKTLPKYFARKYKYPSLQFIHLYNLSIFTNPSLQIHLYKSIFTNPSLQYIHLYKKEVKFELMKSHPCWELLYSPVLNMISKYYVFRSHFTLHEEISRRDSSPWERWMLQYVHEIHHLTNHCPSHFVSFYLCVITTDKSNIDNWWTQKLIKEALNGLFPKIQLGITLLLINSLICSF
jgi:hypothetical protein